jgi:hypothetical protein
MAPSLIDMLADLCALEGAWGHPQPEEIDVHQGDHAWVRRDTHRWCCAVCGTEASDPRAVALSCVDILQIPHGSKTLKGAAPGGRRW